MALLQNETLRGIGRILIPLLLLGGVSYAASVYGGTSFSLPFATPCDKPVQYSIGSIDPRFHISETELKSLLSESASLWNIAAGKTVIEFSEAGTVSVSLVYDDRQAAVKVGTDIANEQSEYAAKKQELDTLRTRFNAAKASYAAEGTAYEKDAAAYQKQVAYWNARGGAPKGEYEKLETTRYSLQTRQEALNKEAANLNALVDQINAQVRALNAFASVTNQKVNDYNKSVGSDFDQGNYVENPEGKKITIYEFKDKDELKRVLAHEFGHALGIGHTENPESIMYAYDIGDVFALSDEDMVALKETCKLK